MNNFHIGQKVVCIKTQICHPWHRFMYPRLIPKGEVVTIRDIFLWAGEAGLNFEEINCVMTVYGIEAGWPATSFRPVKTTDISIFTAMLNPTPQPVS